MGLGGFILTGILLISLAAAVLTLVRRGRRGKRGRSGRTPDQHVLEAQALAQGHATQNTLGPF